MAEYKQYITQIQENGSVMISEDVVATIVAHALSEVEGAAVECGYAMVAPVEAGASLSLAVVTEQGGTCEVALPVPDAGFEKGKAYDVVLKFTTTAVEPVATIGAWVDASDRVEITL